MCLLHYSLFLSSFIPTMFLPLQIRFVSSYYVSILPMFILYGKGYGLLGLPCFLLSFFFFFFFFSNFVFFLLHAFSIVVFVLFHAFLTMFVISFGLIFLSFTQFLLLTLSTVLCFFSSCFFILVFTSILLYKRIWAFMGQIIFINQKVLGPNLP